MVYSAGPRELAEFVCQEFERESGIKTQLFCATTGEVMAKLQAEEFRPQADVVILAGQTAAEVLKQQKALAPLPRDNYLRLNPSWNDPDSYYAAMGACALGVALRSDRYDPKWDWDDILGGAIPGRMIMPSPSQSGTSAEFVVNFHLTTAERFWAELRSAKTRGLQVSGPNSQALTSLVMGAYQMVLGAADYLVFRQMEKGEPVVMHFPPSGCPLSLRPVAILATSQRKSQAESFVRFCFTSAAQRKVAAVHLLPADPEIELSAMRKQAPALHPLLSDVKQACQEQNNVLRRFRYEIELSVGGIR